jgi:SAM-dependent methyltransferase
MDATGPNAEQITYWNETAGPKWVALQELLDPQIEPLGHAAMDLLGIEPGAHVLDVGCGTGQTSVELGRRVGPSGRVTGVDVSSPMLERARKRAAAAGSDNVAFVQADAQTHEFGAGAVDVCFSRFGIMFFADPTAAFANLRAALRPDGRLGFVCWQALPDNPWMAVPCAAALQHVSIPTPPTPHAPGPFAFADADRVRGILESAGLRDVVFTDHRATLAVGGDLPLERAVEFLLEMGPTGRTLREADPGLRPVVAAAVRDAVAPFHTPEGLRMRGAAWLVTARA